MGKHKIGKELTPCFHVIEEFLTSLSEVEVMAVPDFLGLSIPASVRLNRI